MVELKKKHENTFKNIFTSISKILTSSFYWRNFIEH